MNISKKHFKNIIKLFMLYYVYFVAYELFLFNHSHLAVLSIVLIVVSFCTETPWANLYWHPACIPPIFFFFFFFFFFLHFSWSSSYLYFFCSWASSACSSHGTVNSHINVFFILFKSISMFGQYSLEISILSLNQPLYIYICVCVQYQW